MYRIFIVEDDEIIARTVKSYLKKWNYAVHCVENFNDVILFVFGIIPYILFLIFPQLVGLGLFGLICVGMVFGDYLNINNAIKQMPKNSKTNLCVTHSYWYL